MTQGREGVFQAWWEMGVAGGRGWRVQGKMKDLDLIMWVMEATGRY